ncbi:MULTISPECIES: GlxA family transcriptional regulator [Auritidibacter]|uniref:Helix-turn-helix domain-containing protein n=1 Tax=Auritidibacter ignavus TaxID=678932 RepID=A0AAJ6DBN3_9MICC|nr:MULTISPECIES: helix-turn-helix domain-containing protein [Auritidibacter]AXR74279.1 helix-turn-helix domain-containing protein [Auritidibacter sp. NML130574]WGH82988.1 helix-turn-helix domain-containing protein [Auritidibacter ignavus]WGH92266.1 helix-turn-helix domain-containing protein [Auritidibacter ignavus]WHS34059.1 helix-turn-helix domain-containing protein [Auritidibacter ignavus]
MSVIERLVVVVVFEHVDLLDVTGPPEVFALLQREMDEPTGYEVVLAAETMDPVTTSAGVRILPDVTFDGLAHRSIDTLVVPGSVRVDEHRRVTALVDDGIADRVADLASRTRRVTSVCVGAHILAATGLLDGKRATTHWSTVQQLPAEHPEITVDADPIFIRDGNVWTGAGISSCLDLSLALVADDFGEVLAQKVARQLVVYLKRPSGQSQFSVPLEPISTTRRVDELRHYIAQHLAEPLTVADLAANLHIGDRQLTRIFKQELGMTPAAYVESARLEAARNRLETTDDTLTRIATACGFGTFDTLTRAFRRALNVTPSEYRSRFRVH